MFAERNDELKQMESQPPVPETGLPKQEEAGKEPVEKIETPDYVAELKARDERITKLQMERDNYRKMGLKYKKEADDTGEIATDEEKIRQIAAQTAQEIILGSDIARANAEKDEFIKKIAKENSEMRATIANKAQISNMPGGASQPSEIVTVEKLASDQKAELEAKARELGVDPVKFIASAVKNLSKIK